MRSLLPLILIVATVTLCLAPFLIHSKGAKSGYLELIERAKRLDHNTLVSAQQRREGVLKEIWVSKERPFYMRLLCKSSELFFFEQQGRIELVEQMDGVRCLVQEELFYLLPNGKEAVVKEGNKLLIRHRDPRLTSSWVDPELPGLIPMQHLCYFEAKRGEFHYETNAFTGEEIHLWRYRAPGHDPTRALLDKEALFTATSKSIECSLAERSPQLTAYQLQATLLAPPKHPLL